MIREVQERAARHYGVSMEDLIESRKQKPTRARHVAMYVLNEYGVVMDDIAEAFNRHRSTVVLACQNIDKQLIYPDVKDGLDAVRSSVAVEIEIDELPPGLNGSKGLIRMHYHAYRKLRDRWTLLIREQAGPPKKLDRCEVEIERRYARLPMDTDNAYASAKIPLDALRHAGVISDDDPESVTALRVKQTKVDTVAEEKTIITLAA